MISRVDGVTEALKFLVVDDDQISVMAIKRALKKLEIANPVIVAKDGLEALEILRGSEDTERLFPPYIITLDINMPRMNGLEFLDALRADPCMCEAIVFVLTTSDSKNDIASAYGKNVAGYILKDNINASLEASLKMICTYTEIVVLPA
jgi:CheY-like chemotaxis protein